MIKIEMLRAFRAVAEQGSLAAAASVLGRTPSAVSMTLAQLEAEVGAPLFETDRKSRLTALGVLVLDEAGRATDAVARSVDAIRRHALSTAGTVRIAAVPSATVTLLPGVIRTFRAERPDVRLEISDVDSAAVRRRVRLDEADIGILSAGRGDRSGGETILSDDLGIVCRAGGPIAAGNAAPSWRLLLREPLIANPLCDLVPAPIVGEILDACNMAARNTTALLSFVREGIGATVLPRSAVRDASGVVFIAPTDPPVRRELRKVHNTGRRLGPAAAAFWSKL